MTRVQWHYGILKCLYCTKFIFFVRILTFIFCFRVKHTITKHVTCILLIKQRNTGYRFLIINYICYVQLLLMKHLSHDFVNLFPLTNKHKLETLKLFSILFPRTYSQSLPGIEHFFFLKSFIKRWTARYKTWVIFNVDISKLL